MKNGNRNSNNNLDRKFVKQVSHLSGFIGMPTWNGRNPTLSETREYDRLILEKQAQTFKPKNSLLKRLNSSIGRIFAAAFEKVETNKKTENMGSSGRAIIKTKERKESLVTTGNECCG